MALKHFICLILIICAVFVSANDSKVVELTASAFTNQIQQQQKTLVSFYAAYCAHSQNLAPEYAEAANILDGRFVIAQVDCGVEENDELCNTYNIQGFPTLLLIDRDGEVEAEYDDARIAQNIADFVVTSNLPSVTILATKEEYDPVVGVRPTQETDIRVVLVRPDIGPLSQKNLETLTRVANRLRSRAKFYAYTDKEVSATAVLRIYRSFDDAVVEYNGALDDEDEITIFLQKYTVPLFTEIGPHNFQRFLERQLPITWVFLDPENTALDLAAIITPVAKEFADKLVFCKIDGVKWAEHASSFGLEPEPLPGIVIEDRFVRRNFIYPQATASSITTESLREWVDNYMDGKLEAVLRSEPIPQDQTGPVKTLVGKTFEEVVYDTTKDVFVSFHASWCGHCQQLHPIWEEFATVIQQTFPDVVVAQVEATLNDLPVEIEGFPTLILFPAKDKENPIRFNGDRSVESLVAFVTKVKSPEASDSDAPQGEVQDLDLKNTDDIELPRRERDEL